MSRLASAGVLFCFFPRERTERFVEFAKFDANAQEDSGEGAAQWRDGRDPHGSGGTVLHGLND